MRWLAPTRSGDGSMQMSKVVAQHDQRKPPRLYHHGGHQQGPKYVVLLLDAKRPKGGAASLLKLCQSSWPPADVSQERRCSSGIACHIRKVGRKRGPVSNQQ